MKTPAPMRTMAEDTSLAQSVPPVTSEPEAEKEENGNSQQTYHIADSDCLEIIHESMMLPSESGQQYINGLYNRGSNDRAHIGSGFSFAAVSVSGNAKSRVRL